MISVLIPVYNCDITALITTLEHQLSIVRIPYEIVIIDDGSNLAFKEKNRAVIQYKSVEYSEFPYNKGRIATRNELMKKAAFDWLLFLDADSQITYNKFIEYYIQNLHDKWDVIVGGRIYSKITPADCRLRLHWTYGSKREMQLSEQRSKRPYAGFMSNNFLIRKAAFQKLQITEALVGYGHEDTWMGIQLERMGAKVLHLDNPALHNGLEDNKVFIEKSLNSLQNLQKLQKIVGEQALKKHVKLYAFYCRCKNLGLLPIANAILTVMQPIIQKQLASCKPSLFLFDLYRLHHFAQIAKQAH
ncbi:MAG TPA: glycosyltransferase family 2 protein [Flavisolibacter sp.]|nr:glycosyltransferase family 2 protein [Flavisolibacter sp.]